MTTRDWLGLDADWPRPGPTANQQRNDVWMALVTWAFLALSLEATRSVVPVVGTRPLWLLHVMIAVITVPLALRRRFPVSVAIYSSVMFVTVAFVAPLLGAMPMTSMVMLFAIYTAMAWAPSRHLACTAAVGICVLMFGWIVVTYIIAPNAFVALYGTSATATPGGLFSANIGAFLGAILINVVYFAAPILGGQLAWRHAWQQANAEADARLIAHQAATLRDQAITAERLRIARELHDVVAHHVSSIGIQAGAARRVLDRNPAAAAEALTTIEHSSRSAVTEMRTLLGTLRLDEPDETSPAPGMDQLNELVAASSTGAFTATLDIVGDVPVLAPTLSLTVYRIVQESLTNIRRHSSAHCASVVVRVHDDDIEVEIVDDGHPIGGMSGAGVGQRGMRERVATLGGTIELGPRATNGYRVRAVLPKEPA